MKKYPRWMTLLSYLYPYRIEVRKGQVTPSLEVALERGELLLNTSRVNYSYGSLQDIFLRTFRKINIEEKEIKNVLILGFGAGSIATLLTDIFHKECQITGVEADQVVIDLAKKYFNIARFKKLQLHHSDAYHFIMDCQEQFDLITVDIFIDEHTPSQFFENEFITALDKRLGPSGIICYNTMVSSPKTKENVENLIKAFHQMIGTTLSFQFNYGDGQNRMIVYERSSKKINA